jgi:hypothetical protein
MADNFSAIRGFMRLAGAFAHGEAISLFRLRLAPAALQRSSDRKLKLPPDPFRHQDSAITPAAGRLRTVVQKCQGWQCDFFISSHYRDFSPCSKIASDPLACRTVQM